MITTETKILVVPGYLLFPFETGAGVAQYNFIDGLRHRVNLSVLLSPSNIKKDKLSELKDRWDNVTFYRWEKPEYVPKAPSLKERVIGKLSRTFGTTNEEVEKERSEKYKQIHYNIENILLDSPNWMKNQLDKLLQNQKFDLIQFDLPINIGLGKTVGGRAKTIFVHHEIKFQRIETMISESDEDYGDLEQLKIEVENREVLQLNDFDAVQVFHADDAKILEGKVNKPIFISPFSVDDKLFRTPYAEEKLQRIIFVGSDEHVPNLDGLDWFFDQVQRNEKALLSLKVHVIGKWSEENQQKYAADWIRFEGFVDDLSSWFPNSVLIAPIRLGAGLRTKIMEAMAASVPVISTKFASQGIDFDEAGICIAENINETLLCLEGLLSDNQHYREVQAKVKAYAWTNFSSSNVIDKRLKNIDETLIFADE